MSLWKVFVFTNQTFCRVKKKIRNLNMSEKKFKPNCLYHTRRMEREAKAKFVASVWGADFVQFFSTVGLEEMVEFILFFHIDWGKTASVARNWTKSAPQTDATTFAFASLSILLLWSIHIWRVTIKWLILLQGCFINHFYLNILKLWRILLLFILELLKLHATSWKTLQS